MNKIAGKYYIVEGVKIYHHEGYKNLKRIYSDFKEGNKYTIYQPINDSGDIHILDIFGIDYKQTVVFGKKCQVIEAQKQIKPTFQDTLILVELHQTNGNNDLKQYQYRLDTNIPQSYILYKIAPEIAKTKKSLYQFLLECFGDKLKYIIRIGKNPYIKSIQNK